MGGGQAVSVYRRQGGGGELVPRTTGIRSSSGTLQGNRILIKISFGQPAIPLHKRAGFQTRPYDRPMLQSRSRLNAIALGYAHLSGGDGSKTTSVFFLHILWPQPSELVLAAARGRCRAVYLEGGIPCSGSDTPNRHSTGGRAVRRCRAVPLRIILTCVSADQVHPQEAG